MKITAVLPISRVKYLDRVLESLKNQTIQPNQLVAVWDGHESEFLIARNKIKELPYETLFVPSTSLAPAYTIPDRRRHITNIHNQMRELIGDCDYVWSIEDDGILPKDALLKLTMPFLAQSSIQNKIGMVTGVELGRWGMRYVGAWRVDNVFEPTKIESIEFQKTGSEKIDACGLYCALIPADMYKSHEFLYKNGLGPDINLGLYCKQQGLENYIDWSLHVTHLTNLDGEEVEIKANSESRVVKMYLLSGSTWGH